MKISALAALIDVLSILSTSTRQAGGASGVGGDIHSGPNTASNGQSQGQKGDTHSALAEDGAARAP